MTEQTTQTQRLIGQVKWFNNKAGYGFITMTDNDGVEKDVFAHYTTIRVGDSQYRYLVQGEYVEFELSVSTNTSHEFQATNISGIKSGMLMCQTRQTNRVPKEREYTANADANVDTNASATNMTTAARFNASVRVNTAGASRKPTNNRPKRQLLDKQIPSVDMDGFKVVSKKKYSTVAK